MAPVFSSDSRFFVPLMFLPTAGSVFSPLLGCALCHAASIDLPGAAVSLSQRLDLPLLFFPVDTRGLCLFRRFAFSFDACNSRGSSAALPDQLSSPAFLLTSLSLVPSTFWWLRRWHHLSALRLPGMVGWERGGGEEGWALFAHRNYQFSLIF